MNERIERVRERMKELGLEALVVASPFNRRYLSGFTGTAGTLVVGLEEVELLTDFRYTEQAAKQAPGVRVVEVDDPLEGLARSLERLKARRAGYESHLLTVKSLRQWEERVKVEWAPVDALVEALRGRKEPREIERIEAAVRLADRAFEYILPRLRGRTEREVAFDLEFFMRKEGAERLAFPPIVASGPNGSLPHAVPTDRVISDGDLVTLDFGAVVDGYCSDMTRTVAVGKADGRQKEIYSLVLAAQRRGVEATRPGRLGKEVDAEARRVIEEAGYGERFGHGLGHGVGLEIHEEFPRLSKRGEVRLEPGMVTSVEPGVYIPGWGGVRIEDLVVVEDGGCRVLTQSTKELIEV